MQRPSIAPHRNQASDEPTVNERRKSVFHSRPSVAPQASATLDLEHLEQEITLTLQEIDKNLSRSNKIINDLIMPVIKAYAGSSRSLLSAVHFWKTFFENSANVQLAGYEEPMDPADPRASELEVLELRSEASEREETETLARYPERAAGDISDSTIKQFQKRYSQTAASPHQDTTPYGQPQTFQTSTPDQRPGTEPMDTSDNTLPVPSSRFIQRSPENRVEDSATLTVPGAYDSKGPPTAIQMPSSTLTKTVGLPLMEGTLPLHPSGAGNQYKIRLTHSPVRPGPGAAFSPRRSPERAARKSITAQFDSSPEISPPRLMSDVHLSPVKNVHGISPMKTPRVEKKPRAELLRFPDTPKYNSENGGDFNKTPRGIEMRYADTTTLDGGNTTEVSFNKTVMLPKVLTARQRQTDQRLTDRLDDMGLQSDGDSVMEGISPPVTILFARGKGKRAADIIREILGSTSTSESSAEVSMADGGVEVSTADGGAEASMTEGEVGKDDDTEFHSINESTSTLKQGEVATIDLEQAERLEPIGLPNVQPVPAPEDESMTDINRSGFEFDAFLDTQRKPTSASEWSEEDS